MDEDLLRSVGLGVFVGSFDEFAADECGAGADERAGTAHAHDETFAPPADPGQSEQPGDPPVPSDSPLPSDSPGSPPADDADTAVVGPLVPIVVWRAARHDPPVGLGSGIGPTPRLAALLTGLYTDPGVTVVDLTGDARLTAAAGGRRYLAVDDEAGLRRATHLAGTVGLIVFSWPPAPGPPPPGAGPLVRRRPTLPAGSIRHPPAGPATQPHAAAPAATDRPARPGPRRGFCSADRPAAVSGSAAGTGVPFGCRSGSAVERRWPGPGRDPADRGAPIRWPGVAGA